MSETWEETKARLRKQGIVAKPSLPKPLKKEEKEPEKPKEKLYNIHKRSLPPGIDKIVVFSVMKQEAEWWIERRLKARTYEDDTNDTKTLVYYDIVPVDATPKERNIYSNPARFCTEEFPANLNAPRRIN